jgi:hypothetical protein
LAYRCHLSLLSFLFFFLFVCVVCVCACVCVCVCVCVCALLEIEPRAFLMLGKCLIPQLLGFY